MGDRTGIEWTDATWNPSTGCSKVLGSEDRDLFDAAATGAEVGLGTLGPKASGCRNCYAMGQAARMQRLGVPEYATDGPAPLSGPGFGVAVHPHRLEVPLRWARPRRVFVNSMSDLAHAEVSEDFVARVFAVMALTPRHTFQLLTKRHARLRNLLRSSDFQAAVNQHAASMLASGLVRGPQRDALTRAQDAGRLVPWPLPNVWVGVSVENQRAAELRLPALMDTPAARRWISAEPLLGALDLCRCPSSVAQCWLHGASALDWVVVGGESGPGARPMHPQWARDVAAACSSARVPFLFKQWGEWAPQGPLPTSGPVVPDDERTGIVGIEGHLRGRAFGSLTSQLGRFSGGVPCEVVRRVGKKAAGRHLDGALHDGYPEPA